MDSWSLEPRRDLGFASRGRVESRDQKHHGGSDGGPAGWKAGLAGGLSVGEGPGARASVEVSLSWLEGHHIWTLSNYSINRDNTLAVLRVNSPHRASWRTGEGGKSRLYYFHLSHIQCDII